MICLDRWEVMKLWCVKKEHTVMGNLCPSQATLNQLVVKYYFCIWLHKLLILVNFSSIINCHSVLYSLFPMPCHTIKTNNTVKLHKLFGIHRPGVNLETYLFIHVYTLYFKYSIHFISLYLNSGNKSITFSVQLLDILINFYHKLYLFLHIRISIYPSSYPFFFLHIWIHIQWTLAKD